MSLREKEEEERAEEEERRKREEKARKEEEEYQKLIASFQVDEEGFDETAGNADGEEENQLQAFIQYVKVSVIVGYAPLLLKVQRVFLLEPHQIGLKDIYYFICRILRW